MKKTGTYHHGDLKNALIKAGIQVLAQDGVTGLSQCKVARKAGVSQIVADCQAAGVLRSGDCDVKMVAVSIWGLIHGLVSLVIEGQVPSKLMKRNPPKAIVIAALQQVILVPIDASILVS